MKNEEQELAEFMIKFQNKIKELREDFDKLSENNKRKFNKMMQIETSFNFWNILNFINNPYI